VPKVSLHYCIQLFSNSFSFIKVNENGVISLESSFSNAYPETFPVSARDSFVGVIMIFARVDQ
jgi:hypothetical protein